MVASQPPGERTRDFWRYGVSTSTISKTLRFLEEREILRREEQKDSVRWRLEDPFFAAWLKD